jgi:hypothetical protein
LQSIRRYSSLSLRNFHEHGEELFTSYINNKGLVIEVIYQKIKQPPSEDFFTDYAESK